MRGSLANSMPAQKPVNTLIGVTFVTGVTVTGVTGVTLSNAMF
jgi:hypothetical protein